ncbi:MAG: GNAT family N-acetyltransferase [Myxococcales bacterium]|nr:GNAT family N-acetyltransferase [Myxococcales bacterium]
MHDTSQQPFGGPIAVAGARHLATVWRLGEAAFADRGIDGPTLRALFRAPDVWTLVAEAERLIGFAMVRVQAAQAELLAVAVAPAARRSGWGRRLVQAALALAARRGARRVRLDVADGHPAVHLFRALGFVPEPGPLARYPGGQPALSMVRPLQIGESP